MAFDILQTAIESQADSMRLFLPQLIPPVVSPGGRVQAPRCGAPGPAAPEQPSEHTGAAEPVAEPVAGRPARRPAAAGP
jgi:hypothetical protein